MNRTPPEVRRRVLELAAADPRPSNRAIARELGISDHTVKAVLENPVMGSEPSVVKDIPVDVCRTDGLQSRAETDAAVAEDYARALADGDEFPPIEAYGPDDAGHYHVADGIHTVLAHARAGKATVKARVYPGGFEEAWLASRGANSRHGLRRRPEDLRHVVASMLTHPTYADWSAHRIANQCNCSHALVNAMRIELKERGTLEGGGPKAAYYSGRRNRGQQPAGPPAPDAPAADDGPDGTSAPTVGGDGPEADDAESVEVPPAPKSGQPAGYEGLRAKAARGAKDALGSLIRCLDQLKLTNSVATPLQKIKDALAKV